MVVGVDDGEAAGFQMAEEAGVDFFDGPRQVAVANDILNVGEDGSVEQDAACASLGEGPAGEFKYSRLALGHVHAGEPGGELRSGRCGGSRRLLRNRIAVAEAGHD